MRLINTMKDRAGPAPKSDQNVHSSGGPGRTRLGMG